MTKEQARPWHFLVFHKPYSCSVETQLSRGGQHLLFIDEWKLVYHSPLSPVFDQTFSF